MNNSIYAVEAENLTRLFGTFKAVDSISFKVRKGEIFGFLGANGAGKTTTIRMLCGLLMPSSGQAHVNGLDIFKQFENIKQHIGYMSQKFSLYDDLTVRENIQFYGGIYGLTRERIKERTAELLNYLGLNSQKDALTASLPVGWKQRLALSTALLHDPPIIFLDEPTSGVDPVSRRNFWLLIYELIEQGKTVFVTTHFMDEAEYCHRISIMKDGAIEVMGAPAELKEQYKAKNLNEVFMKAVGDGKS